MDPLNFYSNVSSMRAGLTTTSTFTSQPGLSGSSGISSNVIGALSLRAFDDTGLYALRTLTAGNPLPSPLASKPVLDQQLASIDLTNATFGTISGGYSLKINGYVQPPATGTYLFRTTYRDGVSLYISTRKLLDSWTYQGTVQQSVGTLTMYQNVWYNFAIEHAAASSAERLLVEWSNPGGTFATLQQSTGGFTFAYDTREIPGSLMGTSYIYGRANFADVANLSAGIVLPNANFFSGNTSELNNDGGFFKNTSGTVSGNAINISGTVSAAALTFTGTTSGTLLQLLNTVATVSGTITTTGYAALGVTPGTALERFAGDSHRWWTGSSGSSSGTVSMQLSTSSLSVNTPIVAGSVSCNTGSISTLSTSNVRIQGQTFLLSDSSVNNYSTPIIGQITAGTLSPYSDPTYGCLSFPGGTLSYIDYSYLTYPGLYFDWSAQDFTAECRIFTTSLPASPGWTLFGRGQPNTSNSDWSLNVYSSGYVGLFYFNGVNATFNFVRGSTSIVLNAWNHLAVSYVNSSGLISVFLNGSLTASNTKTSAAFNGFDFVVGALTPYATSSNPGSIGTGPALMTDLRVVRGTAVYTGSTYIVPVAPLSPTTNTILLLRSIKTGAYLTGGNVGINQVNPSYALDIVGQARVASGYVTQSLNSWFAIQYIWVGTLTINGDTSIVGTGNWSIAYALNGAAMITLTPSATQMNFPLTGIYSITFRCRTSYTSAPPPNGMVSATFFVMQKYLGVVYSQTAIPNRLGELDTLNFTNNGCDNILSYTGLFLAGDSLLLYAYAQQNIIQMVPNNGIRLTHTLIQPLV